MPSSARAKTEDGPSESHTRVIDEKLLRQLVMDSAISQTMADSVLWESDYDSGTPGWRLVAANLVTEGRWAEMLGDLFGLSAAETSDFVIDRELFKLVPEDIAKRYQLIPLTRAGDEVYIGITDPRQIDVFDHLRSVVGGEIHLVILPPSQITEAIKRYYLTADTSKLEHVNDDELVTLSNADLLSLQEGGESGKIIELVDRLFAHAINISASDIHIEPSRRELRVRFRVDGILRVGPSYPIALCPWIVSRVKILAKLDISERHAPQDGRVRTKFAGATVDMRVSTLPIAVGEKVVIRLLGHSMLTLDLTKLGMSPEQLVAFQRQLNRPQGLVLVTGPTGSGKSTTLYAALMNRQSDEVNVVTVEDPIEYELEGLNQVPVNPKRGVTFPNALRAILRQDPDIILVGEIRDQITGAIAAEAAVTGHLVLSTLHTNDSASTIHRLLEMGVPKHLIAPSLNAVLAQRLMRSVCKECAYRYTPSASELEAMVPGADLSDIKLVTGRGCSECEGTGYRGRVAIHELLVVDDHIRNMISTEASTVALREYAISEGMVDLRTRALELVFSGKTTSQEFHRVVNF
ncbi:MAG: type II/IV secretion system protein [Kofleriaceae bacterium]|nr:type II/IV secretion system protein [Kofleriaceae bacterium]